MVSAKREYIGFYLDKDLIEKLKVISFVTKKDRSVLLREGVVEIIEKNKKTFDEFTRLVESMKK